MIVYVNTLLVAWGKWAAYGRDGGVGWPSCSPMFRDAPSGRGFGSSLPVGVGMHSDDCEVTDRAVSRLPDDLRRLCVEVYQIGGKTTEIAERIGIARETVSRKLDRAHQLVLHELQEIELGS